MICETITLIDEAIGDIDIDDISGGLDTTLIMAVGGIALVIIILIMRK